MLPGFGLSAISNSSLWGRGTGEGGTYPFPRGSAKLLAARLFLDPRPHDVGDRRPAVRAGLPLNRIPRRDLPLPRDPEVEPGPPAVEEPVDDVLAPEPDPELEAREARVRRLEDRGPYAIPVAYLHVRLEEALRREVLPEHPPRQVHV